MTIIFFNHGNYLILITVSSRRLVRPNFYFSLNYKGKLNLGDGFDGATFFSS